MVDLVVNESDALGRKAHLLAEVALLGTRQDDDPVQAVEEPGRPLEQLGASPQCVMHECHVRVPPDRRT
jgi:hypothetical protein